MKKIVSPLFTFCLILCVLSGCQSAESTVSGSPTPHVSDTLEAGRTTDDLLESIQPSETIDIKEDPEEDSEAIMKLLHLCAFPDHKALLKEEFLALVKEVEKRGEKYVLTIDKIEETNNSDIRDDYYTNKEVKNEEYAINLNNGGDGIVIIVDPHNHFKAITLDGLKEYIEGTEVSIPIWFCSVNGNLRLLLEMMLP